MPNTNQAELEQIFADLAYAHLRDQSNSVLDYVLGFQLLKSEDDGKRAVGIFGFEIDDNIYYAPVFFLNGEIRGLDSVYAVKSDLFFPLTDAWVNSLINKSEVNIGETTTQSRRDRGVRDPSYHQLKVIPGGGSVKVAEAMRQFDEQRSRVMPLPEQLQLLGKTAQDHFLAEVRRNPDSRALVERFYDIKDFAHVPSVKTAAEDKPVLIIGGISDEGVEQLTDAQRSDILAGGVAVIDPRPEVSQSQLYKKETTRSLVNPTEPGVYEVLMADGSILPLLVTSTGVRTNTVLVYDPKGGKWCTVCGGDLYAVTFRDKALREWAQDAQTPKQARVGRQYAFVNLNGEGTIGYHVTERLDGLDGCVVLKVRPVYSGKAYGGPPISRPSYADDMPYNSRTQAAESVIQVIITPELGRVPEVYKGKLVVSDKHFRLVPLRDPGYNYPGSPISAGDEIEDQAGRANFDLSDFGDYNTLWEQLDKVSEALDAWVRNGEVHIKTAGVIRSFDRLGAYSFLVRNCGLGKEAADSVFEALDVDKTRWWVKRAAQLDFPELREPSVGGAMSAHHPTEYDETQVVTDQGEDSREVYEYNSPFADGSGSSSSGGSSTLDRIRAAAETGDKDVFDATALLTLIRSYVPTKLVDRYLPSITVGMDRIGRILFLIYWHYSDFAERYGDDEIGDMIDSLSSTFQQLGDLVITLRERSLAGDPEHYGLGLSPDLETDHG